MSKLYQVTSRGVSPLDLDDFKSWAKMDGIDADDYIIQDLIDACTSWGEQYTGKEFRANQYQLLIDSFSNRITLNRAPVDSINSIEHIVDDSYVTVSADLYYLKRHLNCAEIILKSDESWPTNTDEREQAIRVNFTTIAYYDTPNILQGLKRHCLYMYMNRGDCDDLDEGARKSGAADVYGVFRKQRI